LINQGDEVEGSLLRGGVNRGGKSED